MIRIGKWRVLTRRELEYKIDRGFIKGKERAERLGAAKAALLNNQPKGGE